jgi:hypothetical protein
MIGDSRRLQDLVTALEAHIGTARAEGLEYTAALLAMARLDLQMTLYGITDAELRALSDAVAVRSARTSNIAMFNLARRGPCGRA